MCDVLAKELITHPLFLIFIMFFQPEKYEGAIVPRRAAAKYKLRAKFDDWGQPPPKPEEQKEEAAAPETTTSEPQIEGEASVEGT